MTKLLQWLIAFGLLLCCGCAMFRHEIQRNDDRATARYLDSPAGIAQVDRIARDSVTSTVKDTVYDGVIKYAPWLILPGAGGLWMRERGKRKTAETRAT